MADIVAYKEKMINETDRVLVLEEIEGQKAKAVTGLADPRLFKGGNKLHAFKEPQTNLWYLKYDSGFLPEGLRGHKFTKFSDLLKHTESYFLGRGIRVKAIQDDIS